jgi:hypothetical protein
LNYEVSAEMGQSKESRATLGRSTGFTGVRRMWKGKKEQEVSGFLLMRPDGWRDRWQRQSVWEADQF